MVKRFHQKKHEIVNLDLHGVQHSEVFILVEDFILKNQSLLPLKLITGNSDKMKSIVLEVIKKHNFNYSEGDYYNRGYILVLN
tara:strand:- start:1433 stop:1681 length:249 start_codon:yes stop_codon:yes gene_type:complete